MLWGIALLYASISTVQLPVTTTSSWLSVSPSYDVLRVRRWVASWPSMAPPSQFLFLPLAIVHGHCTLRTPKVYVRMMLGLLRS